MLCVVFTFPAESFAMMVTVCVPSASVDTLYGAAQYPELLFAVMLKSVPVPLSNENQTVLMFASNTDVLNV